MIKTVENDFNSIRKYIETLEARNRLLLEENKNLKDEHYKDKKLSEMRLRLDDMQKDYYSGFPISEDERKRIKEWMDKHEEEVHNCHSLNDKLRRGGGIGGTYKYEFIPTSIGTIGTIVCTCGAKFTFQDGVSI